MDNSSILIVQWGTSPVIPLSARAKAIVSGMPLSVGIKVTALDPLQFRHRVRLRLPFREWSRAVDHDGLAGCRQWLAAVEDKLNGPSVPPEPVSVA